MPSRWMVHDNAVHKEFFYDMEQRMIASRRIQSCSQPLLSPDAQTYAMSALSLLRPRAFR
jgi:hypothetical protein